MREGCKKKNEKIIYNVKLFLIRVIAILANKIPIYTSKSYELTKDCLKLDISKKQCRKG